MYFWTYWLQTTWLDQCLKSLFSEHPARINVVNGRKKLFKVRPKHLYHIYWSLFRQFRFENCLWVIWKILGLFVNPFTANNKYSFLSRGNLLQHVQMQLSRKLKIFSNFFLHLLSLDSSLDIFLKKDDSHS